MIVNLPTAKLRSSLKQRVDGKVSQTNPLVWLNYQLFLKHLAKLSADKAKEDKSSVIQAKHIRQATKEALGSRKG